ncbi:MAG: glycosyltransferase [uncultured archaeon A07HR60]|nr:MAG: glycosyltransferase [uncultured archaeon A07HR60]
MKAVAAFTDTYLPTVNGVSYTVATWSRRWRQAGGVMNVVYPGSRAHSPGEAEFPVRSAPFPLYDGYRFGLPSTPATLPDPELVHAHTPFTMGLAGRRFAHKRDLPFVASFHTPTAEYTQYVSNLWPISRVMSRTAAQYERWFYRGADAVVVPSEVIRDQSTSRFGETPVHVVPNGVDTNRFQPVDDTTFRDRRGLGDELLVGYTGRHGYEKQLGDLVAAVDGLDHDARLVIGGDGPAREGLVADADARGIDAKFPGFLDRSKLPAFYSALDVFCFPSPVETQGLVALEAMACGTPVVGADEGALVETIDHDETGYLYSAGDPAAFRTAISRAIDTKDRLQQQCIDRRDELDVSRALEQLRDVYGTLDQPD